MFTNGTVAIQNVNQLLIYYPCNFWNMLNQNWQISVTLSMKFNK
jgi:hypothetical protein